MNLMAVPELAPFSGDRIRAARMLHGISQTDLATAIGLSQGAISQIEAGMLTADVQVMGKVADATGDPLSFFRAVPIDLPPVTLRFRKQSKAKERDTNRVKQLLNEAYRIVWGLTQADPRYLPPSLPVVTTDRVDQSQIESIATQARVALQLDPEGPVKHVTRALERAGVIVIPLALPGDEEATETVGHFGASCWPGYPDPALIGYFHGSAGDRQRFTLAHELGHLVLHTRRHLIPDAEDEANRFAGAFLTPQTWMHERFRADPTLRALATAKAQCGMSIQALIMRGAHLGLIDPPRKVSLFKQLSARGWRKTEPVAVHPEFPVLLRTLLRHQFGSTSRSMSEAERQLGLTAFTLSQLAPKAA